MIPSLWQKGKLNNLLMMAKQESEKACLTLNIQKMKIMTSSLITSWQMDRETMRDFISWVPKSLRMVTAAMKFFKRLLLFGREVMTNLDRILKSRDVSLPTKIHVVKAMIFPVVMYGCESWNIRKAE